MKEIDLLPEWYKDGKRQQISYRAQYTVLVGVVVVIVVWNFVMTHSISKATAEIAQAESKQAQVQNVSVELNRLKSEIAQLEKKVDILEKVGSKIDVAGVLAEMSFLIDRNIVLSAVEFKAEKFVDEQGGRAGSGSAMVTANTKSGNKGALPFGGLRFKIVINGVAAGAGDVAELICKLEDSPYFFHVIPLFSRTREIKMAGGPEGQIHRVSEFEISCELANYHREEIRLMDEAGMNKG